MLNRCTTTALVLSLSAIAPAQQHEPFPREGTPAQRELKDPLEGKAPPALQVTDWLNTDGVPLVLADLRGKVVLLDFWGVW